MIFVIWAIVFVAGIWLISSYNGLVTLRLRVDNGWRRIDAQLKRRCELIPNLLESVKGCMQIEPEMVQKVIAARSQALAQKGVKESADAQVALTQSLGKVFALMENYPELKSNRNVLDLQEELTGAESRIALAGQSYNDLVNQYNAKRQGFPAKMIAGFFHFQPSDLYNLP